MSDNYSALPLIGIVLAIMLGFAAFFISFLLAPLAVLALFYLFMFARDRSKSRADGGQPPELSERMAREAEARKLRVEREREGIPVEDLLQAAHPERANGSARATASARAEAAAERRADSS